MITIDKKDFTIYPIREEHMRELTYTEFKSFVAANDVLLPSYKEKIFDGFDYVAEIIGGENIRIRLYQIGNDIFIYDVMLRQLDEPKCQAIIDYYKRKRVEDDGYKVLIATFVKPNDEEITMMFSYQPTEEEVRKFI